MKPKLCKALASLNGKVSYKSEKATTNTDLADLIEADKQYGKFIPRNGKYFTYTILSDDDELPKKKIYKIIKSAHRRIELRTNLKFKKAKAWEDVDFKLDFRTVQTDIDKQLTKNTLMYHYYPISGNSKLRGLCVINKDYYWTSHGDGVYLHKIDPANYPNPTEYTGKTYDFDQVYTHELLHGLGLAHSPNKGKVMSANEGIMSEFLTEEDIARLQAKYGVRIMKPHILKRWLSWLVKTSDRK
jgi:hypothetical protein